jgi:hypothetical protein
MSPFLNAELVSVNVMCLRPAECLRLLTYLFTA